MNGASPLRFGYSAGSFSNIVSLHGSLDEIKLYGRALSPAEINELYAFSGCGADSLQAHWHLNETGGSTAGDSSPCGRNNGVLMGGAGWSVGKNGNAVVLDGVDDYIDIPDNSSLDGMNQLTVAAWVRLDQLPSPANHYTIVGKDLSGADASYRLILRSTGLGQFVVSTTNNYWYTTGTSAYYTTPFAAGTWYHIVGTYDGTTVKVYVNGALEGNGSQAISGPIVGGASPVRIGYSPGPSIEYLKGKVDEVRIYNEALDATEVLGLYQSY